MGPPPSMLSVHCCCCAATTAHLSAYRNLIWDNYTSTRDFRGPPGRSLGRSQLKWFLIINPFWWDSAVGSWRLTKQTKSLSMMTFGGRYLDRRLTIRSRATQSLRWWRTGRTGLSIVISQNLDHVVQTDDQRREGIPDREFEEISFVLRISLKFWKSFEHVCQKRWLIPNWSPLIKSCYTG